MNRTVLVTGFGVVSALGVGADPNEKALRACKPGIGPIASFNASGLPFNRAGEVPGIEAPPGASRGYALLETAAKEALSMASVRDGIEATLVLGTTLGGMERGTSYLRDVLSRGHDRADAAVLQDFLPSCQPAALARALRIRGRKMLLNNACSSGTDAIGLAFEMIREGEADAAVAGGFEPLCEFIIRGFASLQIISPTDCRPFDRGRDGMMLGEGAAVFVLESEESAASRGVRAFAAVTGFGSSSDSHHMTQPDPKGSGVARAVGSALASAGISASDLGYINLHGTGTRLNDLSEYAGMLEALGTDLRGIPCSSTKGLTGHALGAAGAIEAAFTLMAMRGGFVPPNAGLAELDPEMPYLCISAQPKEAAVRHALSDSIGFGGGSSAIVFSSL